MFKYHCLNPIANVGLDKFTANYEKIVYADDMYNVERHELYRQKAIRL